MEKLSFAIYRKLYGWGRVLLAPESERPPRGGLSEIRSGVLVKARTGRRRSVNVRCYSNSGQILGRSEMTLSANKRHRKLDLK